MYHLSSEGTRRMLGRLRETRLAGPDELRKNGGRRQTHANASQLRAVLWTQWHKEGIVIEPESVGMSSQRLARIRPAMERHIGADKIAGAVGLVARGGEVVSLETVGLMDREANKLMQSDAIFRLYSMTKPITCVALMMLYEQAEFQLGTPVAKFIPAFGDLQVYAGGEGDDIRLEELQRPATIRDLLTHTSGLTYHFFEYGPVEAMYRRSTSLAEGTLSEFVDRVCQLPLAFQPGTAFRYSVAHDVAAHLVEVISGLSYDVYLRENLFEPLGMADTGFWVPEDDLDRLCAMYGGVELRESDTTATKWVGLAMQGVNRLLAGPRNSLESRPHTVFRGGVGLVSTASDYYRFCQMMLNWGELEGTRILGRKTVELMVANQLAPELLPVEVGGVPSPGLGIGLGMAVLMDVGQCMMPGSVGVYGWGGAANTSFWIDPREELIGILMAQFQPSGYHTLSPDFRVAAYQAIVD